jgi:allantoinase
MGKSKRNTIKNVFICRSDNSLNLVDITFGNSILQIKPVLKSAIDWKEINTSVKLQKFIKNNKELLNNEYSEDCIEGNFRLLIPGGIDAHVHFDTPGFEQREDFEHASSAAAYGGTTTIIDMPCTSLPPVTSLKNMRNKIACIKDKSVVDYALWGGVRGNDFDEGKDIQKQISGLIKNGAAGFKTYLVSGMDTFTDVTPAQMLETAKMIKAEGGILAVHAESRQVIESNVEKSIKYKPDTWQYYCALRNVKAEVEAIILLTEIARKSKCRIHIVHLSSAEGLEIIKQAQQKGIKITAETCPHYLHFTGNDFADKKISAYLKTAPPVKSAKDKQALWKGLSDNSISFVTTDHAGCNPDEEKSSKDFRNVYGGIPGVEHRVPYLFSEGFLKKKLSLEQTIKLLSSNTASFFNLSKKGFLKPGFDADFAVINLWEKETVSSKNMHSKGKYTPFENICLNAIVEKTFLRGELIADRQNNFIHIPGIGKFIKSDYGK